jgi:hypothetical protein
MLREEGGLVVGGGGGRVEALPSEPCESGIEFGGEVMVSVVEPQLCPSASPHWLQKRASTTLAEPQLMQRLACSGLTEFT